MIRLLISETRKIFAFRITVYILALLLVLNGISVWRTANEPISDNENYSYTRLDVSKFFSDHRSETAQEMIDELDSWADDYASLFHFDESGDLTIPTQEQFDALVKYTDYVGEESAFYDMLRSYLEGIATYSEYLQRVNEDSESLIVSSAFSKPGTYAYRNIARTPLVYSRVQNTTPTASDSSGILTAVEPLVTTVCLIFAVILVALNLSVAEQSIGVLSLIRPTYRGGSATLTAKLIVFSASVFLLTLLFYGTNLIISAYLFGLGDLHRALQSLEGYLTSPLAISAGKFIICFLAAKYIAVLSVGLLFFFFCLSGKSIVPVFLISAAVMGIEIILYVSIDIHSYLSPLRQINLTALLDTAAYFDDYRAINLFDWPIDQIVVGLSTSVVVIAGSVYFSFERWNCGEVLEAFHRRPVRKGSSAYHVPGGLCGYEMYKLFITKGGAAVLFLALAFNIYSCCGIQHRFDLNEVYYRDYAEILAGDLTQEKADYLQTTRADFDSLGTQWEEIEALIASGEIKEDYGEYLLMQIGEKSQHRLAFERAEAQYNYLQEQENDGFSVSFVCDTGYTTLLESESTDVLNCGILFFTLSLGLSAFYPMEEDSHVIELIIPSVRGKRGVMRKKLLCTLIFSAIAWLVCFVPFIVFTVREYGLDTWSVGARSLTQFSCAPAGFSLLAWFIMVQIIKLLTAAIAAAGIFLLSSKLKQTIPTLLISMLLLEFSVFFYALGAHRELFVLQLFTGKYLIR